MSLARSTSHSDFLCFYTTSHVLEHPRNGTKCCDSGTVNGISRSHETVIGFESGSRTMSPNAECGNAYQCPDREDVLGCKVSYSASLSAPSLFRLLIREQRCLTSRPCRIAWTT